MKSVFRLLSVVIVCVFSLCSCGSDNNQDTITDQSFPNFFATVDDLSMGGTAVYTNVGYRVQLNYTAMTADIQISGLKLPDGTAFPTMTLSQIPWSIDQDGWKVIKGTSIAPAISGFAKVPLFTSFEFRIYDRVLDADGQSVYSPGVCVRYTIDGRFRVLSTCSPQLLLGETKSESASGKVFETDDVEYVVEYNTDTRLLNITMNNARFEHGMPMALNIELRNIDVNISGTSLKFDVPAITPSIGGTPFEAFPITNLRGSFNPASGLEFTFHCNPRTTDEAYDVEVECSYSGNRK